MPIPPEALSELRAVFGDRLLTDERLARHTSARIGGPADLFLTARTVDDLRHAARIAWTHGLPLLVLGSGSNVLVSDAGVRGLVVHNRTRRVAFRGVSVTADSGVGTMDLARRCIARGLSGFEWAIGIPGTVGGAVFGNAGAHGGDMAGCVEYVEAVTPQGDVRLTNADLAFEYRSSILKRSPHPPVVLSVTLQLGHDDPAAIQARADAFTRRRRDTQPAGATMGSTFKNPPGDYAGRLIEAAGLKGTRIGGAQISEKHANFFLNVGHATARDVKALIDLTRSEVQRQFGVELELEIELVGEW